MSSRQQTFLETFGVETPSFGKDWCKFVPKEETRAQILDRICTQQLRSDLLFFGGDHPKEKLECYQYLWSTLGEKRYQLFQVIPDWPALRELPNIRLGKISQEVEAQRALYLKEKKRIDEMPRSTPEEQKDAGLAFRSLRIKFFHFLTWKEKGETPGSNRIYAYHVDETTIPSPVDDYRPDALPEE